MAELAEFETAAQQTGDEKLFVRFYIHARYMSVESEKEGRPIFKDTIYIEIMQPGNKENIVCRPVTKEDKLRFAKQYEHYEKNNTNLEEGTPLDSITFLTRAQIEELKFFHCRTVEQLAGMSDTSGQQFPGFQQLKRKAEAYLELANKTSDVTSFAARLEELERKLEVEKKANAELLRKLEAEA